MKFKYIVVGAGLAGATIAERIASQLGERVLVIEERKHIGGNCYDFRDENGILVHKYGPHLFHTNYTKVFEYLSQFTEWRIYQHRVLALVDGKKIPVPFNLESIHALFPRSMALKFEEKLLKTFSYNEKVPILTLKQFKDSDIKAIAEYVYEKIFVNYSSKQWGLKPEDIDQTVTARVPIVIGKDNRYFSDRYQAVPRQGYTKLFEKMLFHPNIKLMLNTKFQDVCRLRSGKIELMGQPFDGILIYTGMIDELFDFKFGKLPYRSLRMEFEILDTEYFQEVATVNFPNDYDFTRITEFKHIHPHQSNKTVILKEYPTNYNFGENIPYYPFQTHEAKKIYSMYKEYSSAWPNLILLGRLAEFKYYDMDDVVKRALDLFCEKLR